MVSLARINVFDGVGEKWGFVMRSSKAGDQAPEIAEM